VETLKHQNGRNQTQIQSSIIVSNLKMEPLSKCMIRLKSKRCLTELYKNKNIFIFVGRTHGIFRSRTFNLSYLWQGGSILGRSVLGLAHQCNNAQVFFFFFFGTIGK